MPINERTAGAPRAMGDRISSSTAVRPFPMTMKQRKRLESMIVWHRQRASELKGLPSSRHHLAKASCIRAALAEIDRLRYEVEHR